LSAVALALVLAAAVCHAGWNLALKKARGSGLAFFAILGILEVAVWSIPVALLTPDIKGFSPNWLVAMAVSAAIHMAYFLLLLKAYKSADLSLAYPLARATGPLLSVLAAIIFLGESPSGIALVGALLIIVGSTWIGLSGARVSAIGRSQLKGIAFALLCGTMIAGYTVWDQQSVTRLAIPVLIFYWGSILMRIVMASPALWIERHTISSWFWHDLRVLLVVAVLAPLAYILVLVAMTLAPLSLVAPAREISILLGVIAGAKLLQEGQMLSRLGAAALMVLGIMLLSVGDRLFP
jgi:drug/metabolite transporter (DMT)-like permease